MNGYSTSMEVDTGAAITIISEETFKKISRANSAQKKIEMKVTNKSCKHTLVNRLKFWEQWTLFFFTKERKKSCQRWSLRGLDQICLEEIS